jgi:hypothetical protein
MWNRKKLTELGIVGLRKVKKAVIVESERKVDSLSP